MRVSGSTPRLPERGVSSMRQGRDGSYRAASGNVVVVTLNYRLGALGFLAVPELGMTGNYGVMDQRQALQWDRKTLRRYLRDSAWAAYHRPLRMAAIRCACCPSMVPGRVARTVRSRRSGPLTPPPAASRPKLRAERRAEALRAVDSPIRGEAVRPVSYPSHSFGRPQLFTTEYAQ